VSVIRQNFWSSSEGSVILALISSDRLHREIAVFCQSRLQTSESYPSILTAVICAIRGKMSQSSITGGNTNPRLGPDWDQGQQFLPIDIFVPVAILRYNPMTSTNPLESMGKILYRLQSGDQ